MAKQDDYTRYTIRIPTPLYERVKTAAGEKSVNAEIVATLEEAYPAETELAQQLIELMSKLTEEEIGMLLKAAKGKPAPTSED